MITVVVTPTSRAVVELCDTCAEQGAPFEALCVSCRTTTIVLLTAIPRGADQ